MDRLPARGPAVRELGLAIPPARMPLLRGTRPLKRWVWIGVFSPELMLCAGDARVGPLAQRWWALALPDGSLYEGACGISVEPDRLRVETDDVRVDVAFGDGEPIEVASPSGRSYIWTRKRAGVPAHGSVSIDGVERSLDAEAVVDESAGYHQRHTEWRWSAGVGRGEQGERLAWNLVTGVHDAPGTSERTVWVDGQPREVPPVEFADDLSRVGKLRFDEWCAREDRTNLLIFRSDYRQPFGTFSGELPGGLRLAHGYGVMEEHKVAW